jgi:hypothetical protein
MAIQHAAQKGAGTPLFGAAQLFKLSREGARIDRFSGAVGSPSVPQGLADVS